jgi:hypothetical protein
VVEESTLVVSDTGDAAFVTFRDMQQGNRARGSEAPALKANEDGSGNHQGLGTLGELLDDCSPMAG